MKKLLLLSIIALIFVGCSKDDETAPAVSIVGTWKVQSHIVEYYNAGGTKIDEENLTDDADALDKIVFTETTAVITSNNGGVENSDIVLSSSNGKNYLHFQNPSISDVDQIEISIVGTKLNFYAEHGAPKVILKVQFIKQ